LQVNFFIFYFFSFLSFLSFFLDKLTGKHDNDVWNQADSQLRTKEESKRKKVNIQA